MEKKTITFLTVLICLCITLFINSCKKDDVAKGIDKDLFEMAKVTNGFVWYKNTETLLNKSSGSGHNFALLRTRYNPTAATMLDQDGKIEPGAVFPEGSLVVKELYNNANSFARYAILFKQSGNSNADANGWVWGYIDAGGNVAESATKKGSACIGCHTQTDHIDYMLMNKFFP